MPNDARLGLVMGVTLVILVAVLFLRKDGVSGRPAGNVNPPAAGATDPNRSRMQVTGRVRGVGGMPPQPAPWQKRGMRTHTVQEGETLMSLAKQYYGDHEKVTLLFHANRDRILAPDRVPTGTVLVIPEKP